VVFVLLATTGWTAIRHHGPDPGPWNVALRAWLRGSVDGRELPDPSASPRLLGRFFDSLTQAQRHHLADRYPLVVGNLNGAPAEVRYRANRTALDQARTVEKKRAHDERLTPLGRQEAGRRMHRFASMMSPGRQILSFDSSGGGRAAEVFGDLGTARRVSVVVPGVDTDLLSFERTERAYTAPVGMADALYDAERSLRPGARTAVVAWADYTAPAGLGVDAAAARLAEDGAVRLTAFVNALPRGVGDVALFCHSYGSVVCGVAAGDLPARVTDIAVAGSPGMRVERAVDLHSQARVWAARDGDDWIRDVPNLEIGGLGHGTDPVASSFGARVLSAAGAKGHTGYFVPGTTSLDNFARVGVGEPTAVSCAGGTDDCTATMHGPARD
jgi:hypothetical protein